MNMKEQQSRTLMTHYGCTPFELHTACQGYPQTDEEIADYISKTHNTVYHPVGTVRMGSDDDEMSPLDPQLRVKGVKGLRVADASVMPQIVAINPNITCYVIGERAAQLIAGEA